MLNQQDEKQIGGELFSVINKLLLVIVVLVMGFVAIPIIVYFGNQPDKPSVKAQDSLGANMVLKKDVNTFWIAQDISTISDLTQKNKLNTEKN